MEIIVQSNNKLRLDKLLSLEKDIDSRQIAQKMIDAKLVKVNNSIATKADYKANKDDIISYELLKPVPFSIKPYPKPLEIHFEDKFLIVVYKPAGIVTHPGSGNYDNTLLNNLLAHCKLAASDDIYRPGIVHRLDKLTSGLLVVAKTTKALINLSSQFANKTAGRKYLAIVWGQPNKIKGTIDKNIGRSKYNRQKMAITKKGKIAITNWELIATNGIISLIRCQLKTGRTHQIRLHFSDANLPIVGDLVYKATNVNLVSKLSEENLFLINNLNQHCLHSYQLELIHPNSNNKIKFNRYLPYSLSNIVKNILATSVSNNELYI